MILLKCCTQYATKFGELSMATGLEKVSFHSNPMATAEFSKVAGILSAALSQHHLLGFEIAPLEFHHLH